MSASKQIPSSSTKSEALCLLCGLCCDGAIFADVKLQRGDVPARLETLGLQFASSRASRVRPAGGGTAISITAGLKFNQPCAALDGCKCTIYAERPRHCQAFECLQLKGFKKGAINYAEALAMVRNARRRFARVQILLRELGDTDEHLAVAKRFRRTADRLQAIGMDKKTGHIYGQLTVAVHDLNFILCNSFYPG